MSQNKNTKKQESHHHHEMLFVHIGETIEVKKAILESLRDILTTLQKFERFKQIRHQKLENAQRLRIMFRQTSKLLSDLRNKLPRTDLKAILPTISKPVKEAPKPAPVVAVEEPPVQKEKPKRTMTELEKIESELAEIEGKLKDLN